MEEEEEVFARLFCQFVVQNLSSEVTYIASFYRFEVVGVRCKSV